MKTKGEKPFKQNETTLSIDKFKTNGMRVLNIDLTGKISIGKTTCLTKAELLEIAITPFVIDSVKNSHGTIPEIKYSQKLSALAAFDL